MLFLLEWFIVDDDDFHEPLSIKEFYVHQLLQQTHSIVVIINFITSFSLDVALIHQMQINNIVEIR